MKKQFTILLLLTAIFSCNSGKNNESIQKEVQTFLDAYNLSFQKLLTVNNEAQWKLNTMIIENDSVTPKLAEKAGEDFAKFTGSKDNIEKAKTFLKSKDQLTPIQIKHCHIYVFHRPFLNLQILHNEHCICL